MSSDGTESSELVGQQEKEEPDAVAVEEQSTDMSNGVAGKLVMINGSHDEEIHGSNGHDKLVQMVVELNFQNEYLKSQMAGMKDLHFDSDEHTQLKEAEVQENGGHDAVKELQEQMESLRRELLEERQTRCAAEEALKHLREVYTEADAKSQELTTKLAEAQQKMDQEIKERDEKNSELDSKLNRLHKRAKQRIQEVQKEKDDLQAQFNEVNEKAERAATQLSALQQELERTRQQANEALKAIDADRQQLRSANNKLRDNIEELRRSLAPKENAVETLQQSLLEKEQMLEETRQLLQGAEEKRLASMSELSAKHQKERENLEAQIADVSAESSKATEIISSLRALVAEKESKIAEIDAASTGEAVRLKAAIETVKGELAHVKSEHEKEKESWEVISQSLKMKLEKAESNCIRAEVELAKSKSQLESELSVQAQLINSKDSEILGLREEIKRLESEFAAYKIRAHALLQKKDSELAAARENDQLKAMEEAFKDAEKELMLLSTERDKAVQDLQHALVVHAKELASRDEALSAAEQQIKNLEMNLNTALSSHQSEKESWEVNLKNVEETWRLRCEALKAETEVSSSQIHEKEFGDIKLRHEKLKDEHFSFRELADRMIEEKDKEISRLLNDNENLRQMLESNPLAGYHYSDDSAFQKQDALDSSPSAAEQQILILARQQAQREEELSQSHRHILALQEEIEELERENRLHSQQVTMLKEELRNMDRKEKREGVDLTYLKNVILKLLETGEVEALLPVVAMLLQFSPDEVQKCQQAYRTLNAAPPSPASDGATSGLSLFSRFSFS
ncbi:OLC1v1010558C1 [Oldenlandia corymbosa var. corymbosa]|uniref:OLC1v1010558C1 n=1 Tax=Oldenlandia corymbosa var. corymbosa TaxID=529605 RepID=A0AAV1DTZ0_OLDCO|nr:OLC1v1010558C1 [Oldenlandia corymbosa var. corymbosa]